MARNGDKQVIINVNSGTVVRVLVLVVITLVALAFIKSIAYPLTLIFISFFLAMALNPAVSKISSMLHTRSRVLATGTAYVFVLAFLVFFFAFVIPPLVKQTVSFIENVPSTLQNIKREDSPFNNFIERYNLEEQVDTFSHDFASRFGNIGDPLLSTANTILTTVVGAITVLVLTFMMLVEGPRWLHRFWATQDPHKRQHRQHLARRMYKVVTQYVNGQVIIAALSGFFATIGIFILSRIFDAPVNAIALGGIVGLFALLPLIGTTLGAAIAVLATLLVSIPLAIAVAIYFIIYQQIENVTIQPYVQSRSSHLTPLIVFSAALLGVSVGGILGALVAIPVAGWIKVLVEEYFAAQHGKDAKKA